jgi:hypothetical protein
MVSRIRWLALLYGGLGLAGVLAGLRLVLRLLAADELSSIGRVLINLGGVVVAPFRFWFKAGTVGQLPGSTFEPATLLAGLGYLGLAGLVALVVNLNTSLNQKQFEPITAQLAGAEGTSEVEHA